MSPTAICGRVHALILDLPVLRSPADAPFQDGLYFFQEEGEISAHAATGRIVRVGNHPRAAAGLIQRLQQHYSGRKNVSVFRKFLGGALMRSRDAADPCLAPAPGKGHWERQDAPPCDRCILIEGEVSVRLRTSFMFRCLWVTDLTERNRLEALLISTLAACETCQPSPGWLGVHAYSPKVLESGLWNSHFVGGPPMDASDLRRMELLVEQTRSQRP